MAASEHVACSVVARVKRKWSHERRERAGKRLVGAATEDGCLQHNSASYVRGARKREHKLPGRKRRSSKTAPPFLPHRPFLRLADYRSGVMPREQKKVKHE